MKTNPPTVYQLRKRNFKVQVSHLRRWYKFCTKTGERTNINKHPLDVDVNEWTLSHFGGETVVTLSDGHGIEYTGTAACSDKDRYVKKTGVKKAIARAYHMWYEVNENMN